MNTQAAWSPAAPIAVDDSDVLRIVDDQLYIEDLPAAELIDTFGSPLFVMSETRLRTMVRRYRAAFAAGWPDGPVDVLAAFKSNTTLATRQILTDEGAGADIYSPGELVGVLSTGVDPNLVSVSGNAKSREHLRRCTAAGVRITVEDIGEVDLIDEVAGEVGVRARIRLRLKPTVPELWRATDFTPLAIPIDLGVQIYKSGIPIEYVEDLGRRAIAATNIDLVGLHVHLGRHHASTWYWRHQMTAFAAMVAHLSRAWGGWQPSELDIGGGMASPRDPHNKETPRAALLASYVGYPALAALRRLGHRAYHRVLGRILPAFTEHPDWAAAPSVEEYARVITGVLRTELHRHGIGTAGVRLQTEPGRGLYGSAGIHLATVTLVKSQTQPIPHNWVFTDTSEFFLAAGRLERNRYPYLVANRAGRPATYSADIVGRSCFADQLVLGAKLPEVVAGDVIAFLETGAYQETSAANFNALPRPATVLVRGRDAEIIRAAETVDDVYARDRIPTRLQRQTGTPA